jgi:membrane-associated phospholipid phosphatase
MLAFRASAQTSPDKPNLQPQPTPTPEASPTPKAKNNFFVNILHDQRAIWLAPFNVHKSDAKWIAPLGLSTMALIATDRQTSGELVENGENVTRIRISKNISYLGSLYATGGAAAALYLAGRAGNNRRARETGVLAGEALINSAILVEALKLASQRQRPPTDNTSGEFFDGGRSFPSGHAVSAWSFATVIAHEYGQHRPLVRFGAYGIATAVSLSRFTGRNHFLSDVLVGSALGYGIGRYVYRERHDPSLDSPKEEKTSRLLRLFPHMAPLYEPRPGIYGVRILWGL